MSVRKHFFSHHGSDLGKGREMVSICGQRRSVLASSFTTVREEVECSICRRVMDSPAPEFAVGDNLPMPYHTGFKSYYEVTRRETGKVVAALVARARTTSSLSGLWVIYAIKDGERGALLKEGLKDRVECLEVLPALLA